MFTPVKFKNVDLLIISGEASGDEHASLLVKDLNRIIYNSNLVFIFLFFLSGAAAPSSSMTMIIFLLRAPARQ